MNYDLGVLDRGEALWLWRRRAALNQHAACALFGVDYETYIRAEKGHGRKLWPLVEEHTSGIVCTPSEALRVCRRRFFNESARVLAVHCGISHVTYLRREALAAPSVVAFWQSRGFHYDKWPLQV